MTPDDLTRTSPPDATRDQADAALDAGLAAAFGGETTHLRPPPADPGAGTVIGGKYRLTERIGEGGMGSVWAATQTEPVKRKVAVKLIKAGMDSKAVLARFDAERQALAVMDHPSIAKVLDGGVHDGRPYFVMELVKGVPITTFCDERKLTPAQRLELFVPVCQAIQHAHQKGVIHRDIKPSNVLVALYDDQPVPKVIDFGIAKATGAALTEHTLETGFGAVVGTPAYMSPEQASLNNLDIDTRSDVYSLGVLLYELLTGSPPFTHKELQKKGLMEMLRVVREEEPPRPSAKLSTADALPTLSANRGTEPKKLTGLLRSELDWVVMKALEKDRARRYETANGFAADVQRYLSGEAVQAHPPNAAYRLKKFVRRNRVQVTAAAVVFLALLAGIGGTTFGLLQADEKRREADQARRNEKERADGETKAKEEEAKQRATAVEEKKRAIAFRDKALAALRATTSTDVEKLIGERKELTANERAYLEAIARRWQTFAKEEGADEESRLIRAEGHHRVARLWEKLGRWDEARSEDERALTVREQLVADFPANPGYRHDLSANHSNLANQLVKLGGPTTGAEAHSRKALALTVKLAADFPGVPAYQHALGMSHYSLGGLLAKQGKGREAEEELREALSVMSRLSEEFPTRPEYRNDMAAVHNALGNLLLGEKKPAEAKTQLEKALAIREKLADEFPASMEYRSDLAGSYNNLAVHLLADSATQAEAVEWFRKALAVQAKLVAEFPAVPVHLRGLAIGHSNLGAVLSRLDRPAEAEEQVKQAVMRLEKLVADFPAVPLYRVYLGGCYGNLGHSTRDKGRVSESLGWFDKAIATLTPIHLAAPRDVTAKRVLMDCHYGRATANDRLRKFADATKDWNRAVELCPPTEQPLMRFSRATSRSLTGQAAEAVAEAAELTKSSSWSDGQWYNFACMYAIASAEVADKKQEHADTAMALLQRAVKAGWKDVALTKRSNALAPLRGREDFKKLLADLEAKYPPQKESPPPRADK